MRQLDPQVVQDRKRRLLQWVIHSFIKTSRPIASQDISREAGLGLSSASVRSVLKELEEEGYLQQPHTSAGRVPTDKGYRFYVDYLTGVQRLASEEKERIEREYVSRVAEMDDLLSQTSRLLSHVSRSAGLVLSPKVEKQHLRRLELIPLGGQQVLAVLVTQAGLVRHWPITLSFTPTASRINVLNRFLNDNIQGKSIREVQATVEARIQQASRELAELGDLARKLVEEVGELAQPNELYIGGTTNILAHPEDLGDPREMQSLIRVMEDKQGLAAMLDSILEEERGHPSEPSLPLVRIGHETRRRELKHVSLVASTYRWRGEVIGVLGVLGSRRMEYSRMISLVNHIGAVVSKSLEGWDLARSTKGGK
ncbi:MAG: heat-inducible transcription repressor HrcA [Elusimicrobia bacterium]|nr:heat-inducible transcription repressor HrcA [Elusimicrobiota bacterium]